MFITAHLGHFVSRYSGWLPNRPLYRVLYVSAGVVIGLAALVNYRSIGTLEETGGGVKHTYPVMFGAGGNHVQPCARRGKSSRISHRRRNVEALDLCLLEMNRMPVAHAG